MIKKYIPSYKQNISGPFHKSAGWASAHCARTYLVLCIFFFKVFQIMFGIPFTTECVFVLYVLSEPRSTNYHVVRRHSSSRSNILTQSYSFRTKELILFLQRNRYFCFLQEGLVKKKKKTNCKQTVKSSSSGSAGRERELLVNESRRRVYNHYVESHSYYIVAKIYRVNN